MKPHNDLPKICRLFYGNPVLMKHNPGDIEVIEENMAGGKKHYSVNITLRYMHVYETHTLLKAWPQER